MLKKKTTVVIDHQAEEQAKQQAMQAELDALKPKTKSPVTQLQDTSVETNRSSLKKIKKSTLTTIGLVVLACAIISLLTWSILHKNYLDQQEKERVAKEKAERVAVEKVNQIINKTGLDLDECHLDDNEDRIECENQKQYDAINQALQDNKQLIPNSKINELLQKQLTIANNAPTDEERRQKLDAVAQIIKQYPANHVTYFKLSSNYRPLDKALSLQYLKQSKELYYKQDRNSHEYDFDQYDFDRNLEELQSEIKKLNQESAID